MSKSPTASGRRACGLSRSGLAARAKKSSHTPCVGCSSWRCSPLGRVRLQRVSLYKGYLAANSGSLVLDPALRMNRAAKNEPPDFISDHPRHETRVEHIEARLPEAEKEYGSTLR